MAGATRALPKERAIFSESRWTRRLCLPSAMCWPFCSVPPIGTMIVVLPDLTRSRSSVQVNSSRNTESAACAAVIPSNVASKSSGVLSITFPHEIALASKHSDKLRQAGDDSCPDGAEDDNEPGRHSPQHQQQKSHDPDCEIGGREDRARPYRLVERCQQ